MHFMKPCRLYRLSTSCGSFRLSTSCRSFRLSTTRSTQSFYNYFSSSKHRCFSTSDKTIRQQLFSQTNLKQTAKLDNKTSLLFSVNDSAGSLQKSLLIFAKHNVNLTRLESRPSRFSSDYDFYVSFEGQPEDEHVKALLLDLLLNCKNVQIIESKKVPWFPRLIKDIDVIANQILSAGGDLHCDDHPGFHDPVYRARRQELADLALNYRMDCPFPRVKYTQQEINTWNTIYKQLMPLVSKHACEEHNRMLPLLVQNCGYREDNIPQCADVSDFLKSCTGFQIRPVAGLLSARNFLYGLAFRVFFSTQYLRHHSKPLYTPEPDVVHELLGHVPLLADRTFADFSQEIGLASIGATEEQITKLARCYWYSVEFGLCYQRGQRKAYGAGLLSSFGELEYSMSEKPEIRTWDPFKASEHDYPITTYQPVYYAAESFEQAKRTMQMFSASFQRPFNVRYNPFTQSIEVDRDLELEQIPGQPSRVGDAVPENDKKLQYA